MNGSDLAKHQEVEQALRRSHCVMTDRKHECAGTMTVTPSGIKLSCAPCGSDDRSLGPSTWNQYAVDVARKILSFAGLDFDVLSAETQAEVVGAVIRGTQELAPKLTIGRNDD